MLRVPGSGRDLFSVRAAGGDIRVVYSPLDAIRIAGENPDKQVVFFAVGFETTAPANAMSVLQAEGLGLRNYSVLVSHVRVPPAMRAILGSPDNRVQGFFQTLVSYFPNRTIANLDAGKEQITIRHLAGMVNGFVSGCLGSDMLSLDRMRSNPDWVKAALDRKMFSGPGTTFCYDSPGMHLLSAVLQEATGMTALEFARQYLFEPLGIEEVVWESDPQGYTHGWGDLHLKPRDAAKLGYLWLNHGLWDGKQIVSATWVEDSVRPHSKAGDENYGYGWWVEDEGFYAMGRAGQSIKVYPSWKLIIVTTASNLEYDQINPYLVRAFVSPDKPLPPNPAGIAQLNEALAYPDADSIPHTCKTPA